MVYNSWINPWRLMIGARVPQLIVKKWEINTSTELKFLENACLNVDNLFVAGKLKRDG